MRDSPVEPRALQRGAGSGENGADKPPEVSVPGRPSVADAAVHPARAQGGHPGKSPCDPPDERTPAIDTEVAQPPGEGHVSHAHAPLDKAVVAQPDKGADVQVGRGLERRCERASKGTCLGKNNVPDGRSGRAPEKPDVELGDRHVQPADDVPSPVKGPFERGSGFVRPDGGKVRGFLGRKFDIVGENNGLPSVRRSAIAAQCPDQI